MNRRNFFKMITGFVAGIFVGSAKAKPQLTVAMLQKVKKELDAQKAKSEGNFVYKGYSFRWSQYKTQGCYLISLDENDDIIGCIFDDLDYDNIVRKKLLCDKMIARIESWKRKRPQIGDGRIRRV